MAIFFSQRCNEIFWQCWRKRCFVSILSNWGDLQKLRGTGKCVNFLYKLNMFMFANSSMKKDFICRGNYCYNKLIFSSPKFPKKAVKTPPLLFQWCICSIVYMVSPCVATSRVTQKIFAVSVEWYHQIVLTMSFKLVSFFYIYQE